MDVSEKYIKMCEKAEEIQTKWIARTQQKNWDCSDFVYDKLNENVYCLGGESGLVASSFSKNFIWLLRQDQLQEMFIGYKSSIWDMLIDFRMWMNACYNFQMLELTKMSMEQLWLAFVMHEKYGKVWDHETDRWSLPEEE